MKVRRRAIRRSTQDNTKATSKSISAWRRPFVKLRSCCEGMRRGQLFALRAAPVRSGCSGTIPFHLTQFLATLRSPAQANSSNVFVREACPVLRLRNVLRADDAPASNQVFPFCPLHLIPQSCAELGAREKVASRDEASESQAAARRVVKRHSSQMSSVAFTIRRKRAGAR
ncbi:hypothetical protein AAT19DRAFT_11902 [Rhodotorula toruloides]|uniref:Uncharacterized protein n=1 Tax=Rhodotorula toruloides TaxID=5286 RepID=A0A2S9ZVV4_RHOTO|nr:hypothetical protein AAT19DRAFT_11902 [Rhodotorula toruloides]